MELKQHPLTRGRRRHHICRDLTINIRLCLLARQLASINPIILLLSVRDVRQNQLPAVDGSVTRPLFLTVVLRVLSTCTRVRTTT